VPSGTKNVSNITTQPLDLIEVISLPNGEAISLNMTVESVMEKVENVGWIIEFYKDSEYMHSVKEYDVYSDTEYSAWLFQCDFNSNNNLIRISTNSELILTIEGLRVGDAESKVKELYGEPDYYHEEGYGINRYGYDLGKFALELNASDGKVDDFRISLKGYTQYL
jgi:hypothetical protein